VAEKPAGQESAQEDCDCGGRSQIISQMLGHAAR